MSRSSSSRRCAALSRANFIRHESEVERTGQVPRELGLEIARKVKALGFFAPNLPVEVGGGGLNALDTDAARTRAWPGVLRPYRFLGAPVGILLALPGEQRERYLLPAARGRQIRCARDDRTRGRLRCARHEDFRAPRRRRLRAQRRQAFHQPRRHRRFRRRVRRRPAKRKAAGTKKKITAFLVDRGTPGFEIRPGYSSVSHRGYQNCILTFDDCRLPAPGARRSRSRLRSRQRLAGGTRLTVAATCVGRARRAFDLALNHAATRKQFGETIGRFQGVSFKLADMITEIDAADLLTLSAAQAIDKGRDATRAIAWQNCTPPKCWRA